MANAGIPLGINSDIVLFSCEIHIFSHKKSIYSSY